MVKLGPVREEACAILAIAREVCSSAREWHACLPIRHSEFALQNVNLPIEETLNRIASIHDDEWSNSWTRNVSRFCADVLRWTHEQEREREIRIMQEFFAGLTVRVDMQTKLPSAAECEGIADKLGRALGYTVEAGDGLQTRHFCCTFDPDKLVFLFS